MCITIKLLHCKYIYIYIYCYNCIESASCYLGFVKIKKTIQEEKVKKEVGGRQQECNNIKEQYIICLKYT